MIAPTAQLPKHVALLEEAATVEQEFARIIFATSVASKMTILATQLASRVAFVVTLVIRLVCCVMALYVRQKNSRTEFVLQEVACNELEVQVDCHLNNRCYQCSCWLDLQQSLR